MFSDSIKQKKSGKKKFFLKKLAAILVLYLKCKKKTKKLSDITFFLKSTCQTLCQKKISKKAKIRKNIHIFDI